jgi:hypothetical protein
VVEAAVHREPPTVQAPLREPGQGSVGLLGDVLDLFVQASRGLGGLEPTARVIKIASRSDPGLSYRVTITEGLPTCECKGFGYRGTCSHIRAALDRLEQP